MTELYIIFKDDFNYSRNIYRIVESKFKNLYYISDILNPFNKDDMPEINYNTKKCGTLIAYDENMSKNIVSFKTYEEAKLFTQVAEYE